MAENNDDVTIVSVQVRAGVEVHHDGTRYGPGEKADVPAEVAHTWIANSWADEAARTKKPKGRK